MATRMSSSTRPKTLNRGATDDRTRILVHLKKRNATLRARVFGFGKFQSLRAAIFAEMERERAEDIAWIENISERAGTRKGGLGRK